MLTGPCDILCYLRNLFHYSDLLLFNSSKGFQLPAIRTGLLLKRDVYTAFPFTASSNLTSHLPSHNPAEGSRHAALQCLSATSSACRDTVCLQLSCTQVTLGSSKGTLMHWSTLASSLFSSSFPHFLPVPLVPALYYAGLQPSCSKFISTEWRFCTRLSV